MVLVGGAVAGATLALGAKPGVRAAEADVFPPLPSDLTAFGDQPDIAATDLVIDQLGTAQPKAHEIETARRIMQGAPYGTRKPIDVARYFCSVGQGKLNATFGEDVRAYVAGWPVRYNPVIINFFKATSTQPLSIYGDGTSWCAAFVNWCIARSLMPSGDIAVDVNGIMRPLPAALLKGTNSASSGSFRCWSKAAADAGGPRVGDVLVWAQDGTLDGCKPGPGHVGFYIGRTPGGSYLSLGGNKRDPRTNHHAVVEKPIRTQFTNSEGTNTLYSIRSVYL